MRPRMPENLPTSSNPPRCSDSWLARPWWLRKRWDERIRKYPKTVVWLLRDGITVELDRENVWRVPR